MLLDATLQRICEIDQKFAEATNWGSWLVELANEREALVNEWNAGLGHHQIAHRYQARLPDGGRVD